MKVLHVIPSLDPADGGPSVAVPLLARAIGSRGHEVVIITTQGAKGASTFAKATADREAKVSNQTSKVDVDYIHVKRDTKFYKISWELVSWLRANIRNFDVVHIHALFSFSSTVAAHIAHRNGVPYIIRPLGVLNQWGLRNRRSLLKRASLALIEKRILTHAAAIHYTAEAERREAGRLGTWIANVPSFVIPLPVDSAASGQRSDVSGQNSDEFLKRFPEVRGKRIVLFLSRIDRKKGIELLLEAFANVRKEIENLILVIAGSGDPSYELSLRSKAEQLKMSESTLWTGFVSGEDKAAILEAAEIFVLPSYSENFGIAAAEAMAAGKACILSDRVGLADTALSAGAVAVTKCDVNELNTTIRRLLNNPEQRVELGNAAQEFARNCLSLDAIGSQLEAQYRTAIAPS